VYFYNETPRSAKPIKSFNSGLIGRYVLMDSSIVLKDETIFNSEYCNSVDFNKDSISLASINLNIDRYSAVYFLKTYSWYDFTKVDTLRLLKKHKKEDKMYNGKYVIFSSSSSDTIANLRAKDIIKPYNNQFYLNHYISKHQWEVFQVEINSPGVVSLSLTNAEDLSELSNHIVEKTLLATTVSISDKKFSEFVKKGGFRRHFKFMKLLQ
jgi:hypothetical protein